MSTLDAEPPLGVVLRAESETPNFQTQECCVCYGLSEERTRCGHPLCGYCLTLLPKPVCPLCRQELSPGALARAAASAQDVPSEVVVQDAVASRRGVAGVLAVARLRARRRGMTQVTRRRLPTDASSLHEAAIAQSSAPQHVAMESPRLPVVSRPRQSPFELWLQQRDSATPTTRRTPTVDRNTVDDPADIHNVPPLEEREASSRSVIAMGSSDGDLTTSVGRANNGRGLRLASLVSRIGRMSLHEAQRFIDHVAWLQEQGLLHESQGRGLATLQQALQRRLAELISVSSIAALDEAGSLVVNFDRGGSSPAGKDLRRALEARLLYLMYSSSNNGGSSPSESTNVDETLTLEDLTELCKCATGLRRRRLVSADVHATCVRNARNWLERASAGQLMKLAPKVAALIEIESSLLGVLSARVLRAIQQQAPDTPPNRRVVQMDRILRLILVFEDLGLGLLGSTAMQEEVTFRSPEGRVTGTGNRGNDDSNEDVRLLEVALCTQLQKGLAVWPPRLVMDLLADSTSGLPKICMSRPTLAQPLRNTLSCRFVKEVAECCDSMRKATDFERVRAELLAWNDCARRASATNLFVLDASARGSVVSAATKFTAQCMGLPDFANCMKDVQDMEWRMVALISCVSAA